MSKINLEKNCLDLEYQKNLQFLNAILIIGTGSIVAYFSSLVLDISKWSSYSIIILSILTIGYLTYSKTNKNLEKITSEIKNLR